MIQLLVLMDIVDACMCLFGIIRFAVKLEHLKEASNETHNHEL